METNKVFKGIYDGRVEELKEEIEQWKQNINEKLELIVEGQKRLLLKKKQDEAAAASGVHSVLKNKRKLE